MIAVFALPVSANGAVFNIADGDSNGLIDAINLANSNGEPDVINLATNGTYTLRRIVHSGDFLPSEVGSDRNGLPPIVSDLTINGHGATITRHNVSSTPGFRLVQVGDVGLAGDAELNDLTLSRGAGYGFGGGVVVYVGSIGLSRCQITDNFMGTAYGGGICNLDHCTLTECIVSRNTVFESNFPPGPGISLQIGDGLYNRGTAVIESSQFIDNDDQGIYNEDGAVLSMRGCLIQGSWAFGVTNYFGTVDISDTHVTSNGLGVGNRGVMSLEGSVISRNAAGIGNYGDLTIVDCDIAENIDTQAILCTYLKPCGGVYNVSVLKVFDSRIRDNVALGIAGGISSVLENFANPMSLVVSGCEVSGNAGSGHGGGIYAEFPAVVQIANSTISNNHAVTGGGIYSKSRSLTLVNSTVVQNEATTGSGIYVSHSVEADDDYTSLVNTIVADNVGGDDCSVNVGAIVSRGHNLDGDGTCNLDTNGDIPFGFANLGPLADNGGPTYTHALLPGSDAIDAGDAAACAADPVNGVDQRGYPRPAGLACDIGAFEVGDFDNDGVIDGVDVCLSPAAAQVNSVGGPKGDIDDDCAVTLDDFVYFELCLYLSGPNTSPLFFECADVFDFDGDNDVDLVDFSRMQIAM